MNKLMKTFPVNIEGKSEFLCYVTEFWEEFDELFAINYCQLVLNFKYHAILLENNAKLQVSLNLETFDENINKSLIPRIVMCFLEGVSLMSTFHVILWFSKFGYFPALIQGNIAIQNDESIHRDYHIERIKLMIGSKLETISALILEISAEILEMELEFVDFVYSGLDVKFGELPEISDVKNYVKYLNIYILRKLVKFSEIPKTFMPPENYEIPVWLESLSCKKRNNFFEIKGSDYSNPDTSNLVFSRNGWHEIILK